MTFKGEACFWWGFKKYMSILEGKHLMEEIDLTKLEFQELLDRYHQLEGELVEVETRI
jgi:hypothetical protein